MRNDEISAVGRSHFGNGGSRSIDEAIQDIVPGIRSFWHAKAFCFCIRNPPEGIGAFVVETTNLPISGIHNTVGFADDHITVYRDFFLFCSF